MVIKKIHDADINVMANYIYGLPGDTKQTMKKTFDLSLELCERIQEGLLGQEREESVDIAFNSWFMGANAPRSLVSRIKEAYSCDLDHLKQNPYQ